MSLPGDSLDPDDRLTTLAVLEHQRRTAVERGLLLDDLLDRIDAAVGRPSGTTTSSDDAAALTQDAVAEDDAFERMLRQRGYREAALPLVALTGQLTRSLADFLG